MPRFLDTRGQPTLNVSLCARCGIKMPAAKLSPDPNSPGLLVCAKDRDRFDPYRLPPRQPDQISVPFVRPDTDLADLPGTDFTPLNER